MPKRRDFPIVPAGLRITRCKVKYGTSVPADAKRLHRLLMIVEFCAPFAYRSVERRIRRRIHRRYGHRPFVMRPIIELFYWEKYYE